MKPWLRLILVTMTVGGGFCGVAITFENIINSRTNLALLLVNILFFLLFGFVAVSGLVFVHDQRRTGLLAAALITQAPWFSSSVFVYKFFAGFDFVFMIGAPKSPGTIGIGFNFEMLLGSSYRFDVLTDQPWRIGLNFVPLVLLVLLFKARNHRNSEEATAEPSRLTAP